MCFPADFTKVLITPRLKRTSWWLCQVLMFLMIGIVLLLKSTPYEINSFYNAQGHLLQLFSENLLWTRFLFLCDRMQILLIILSEFKRMSQLLFPLKLSESHRFSDQVLLCKTGLLLKVSVPYFSVLEVYTKGLQFVQILDKQKKFRLLFELC